MALARFSKGFSTVKAKASLPSITSPTATTIYTTKQGGKADLVKGDDGVQKLVVSYPAGIPLNKRGKPFPNRNRFLFTLYRKALSSPATLIFQDNSMSDAEMNATKEALFQKRCRLLLVRNTVFHAALEDTRYSELQKVLFTRILVGYYDPEMEPRGVDPKPFGEEKLSESDVVSRIISCTAKNKKLLLLGGRIKSSLLTAADVQKISTMPPIAQLQAEALGAMEMPGRIMLGLLERPSQSLAQALDTHHENLGGDKKE